MGEDGGWGAWRGRGGVLCPTRNGRGRRPARRKINAVESGSGPGRLQGPGDRMYHGRRESEREGVRTRPGPTQARTLWRGVSVDLYDQYEEDRTITWWSVSSCTSDEQAPPCLTLIDSDRLAVGR